MVAHLGKWGEDIYDSSHFNNSSSSQLIYQSTPADELDTKHEEPSTSPARALDVQCYFGPPESNVRRFHQLLCKGNWNTIGRCVINWVLRALGLYLLIRPQHSAWQDAYRVQGLNSVG